MQKYSEFNDQSFYRANRYKLTVVFSLGNGKHACMIHGPIWAVSDNIFVLRLYISDIYISAVYCIWQPNIYYHCIYNIYHCVYNILQCIVSDNAMRITIVYATYTIAYTIYCSTLYLITYCVLPLYIQHNALYGIVPVFRKYHEENNRENIFTNFRLIYC